eukprot:10221336-Lingulodinium_polyedra.AAC.1
MRGRTWDWLYAPPFRNRKTWKTVLMAVLAETRRHSAPVPVTHLFCREARVNHSSRKAPHFRRQAVR